MAERFRDSMTWPVYWPALVRCPRCEAAAIVRPDEGRPGWYRLSCAGCTLQRDGRGYGLGGGELRLVSGEEGRNWRDVETRVITTWPVPQDAIYDLWLRTPCCGTKVLWATNEEHLSYLEDYIGATLRERPEARISPMGRRWVGRGLSSKLPEWMKSAKHRDEVVAGLARLRAALPPSASGGARD